MKKANLQKPIFFAVGGTGGHLYPAQVLYERLLKKDANCEVWFLGKGLRKSPYLEAKFKEKTPGLQIREIASATLSKNPFKTLVALFKLTLGCFQAAYWTLKKRPQSVVGFGSFYSAPTLLVAALLRVPIFLYESDLKSGIANRIFAPFAKKIGVCFMPQSEREKRTELQAQDRHKVKRSILRKVQKKVQVEPLLRCTIANTISRADKEKIYRYFGLDPKKKTLLVFGGSQGAAFINEATAQIMAEMGTWTKTWQLLHFSGKNACLLTLKKQYEKAGFSACVKSFEPKMSDALSIADIAVCRAGSSSILELMAHQVPSLLIPYPHAYNHQDLNALFMVAIGAAKCLRQSQATQQAFRQHLTALMGDEKQLDRMRKAMKEYKKGQEFLPFEKLVINYAGAEK